MRHNQPLLSRVTFAVALALSAASLVAYAGEASDSTEIQVFANGKQERITLDDLKTGETRQVYSEAGTLVTVTRLADSIELDIAGEKTSVPMHDGLDAEHLAALIHSHDGVAADGEKRVVRIHHAGEKGEGDGHHKVIVLDHAGGDAQAVDMDDAQFVVKLGDDGEKQVIVKRKVIKESGAGANDEK
jgi:hypothetical protein